MKLVFRSPPGRIAVLWLLSVGLAPNLALAQTPQAAAKDTASPHIIEDGQAQVVDAFKESEYWIRHDLWVETSFDSDHDGNLDRMHVDVTRPSQTEFDGLQVPVIYESSPYYAGTAEDTPEHFWDVRQEVNASPPPRKQLPAVELKSRRPIISKSLTKDWVPRGFAVVHSSSPGTGLSQGCPTVGGDNESLAPKAVIDWLCGRATGYASAESDEVVKATWSTGKVAMMGTSYNGTLALAAATTGVEGLEAIIPVAPNTSYYHYYRSNGLIRNPGGYAGEDIDFLYEYIHSGNEAMRKRCDGKIRDDTLLRKFDRQTGDYNDFWAARDYLNDLQPMRAAMLMAHGFNDWNVVPEHSHRILTAARDKGIATQAYYHQSGHGGPPPMRLINRWLTRYLLGVENDVENDPQSWIVREGDKPDKPTPYPRYPHPDAQTVRFYPVGGAPGRGTLSMQRMSLAGGSRVETLIDNYSFDGDALSRAEITDHRLIYLTEPMKRPVHLSGAAKVKIRLASSKPAVNLSVWLVSLPWDDSPNAKITDNLITRGWADPQNHKSIRHSEPLVPGQFYDVEFELQPDDQILPAGQQIGWMIFCSDRDFTLHPQPGTELTIDLSSTHLDLPIVGGDTFNEQQKR